MATAPRASASDVRRRMESGAGPLLVCAYDDEKKCEELKLPGSISLGELRRREAGLPHSQEIVFY